LLLAVAALVASASAVVGAQSASAATAPSVSAKPVSSDVRLAWKFSASTTRSLLTLKIDRRTSTGGWIKWKTVDDPTTTGTRTDGSPRPGTSYYRVRLFNRDDLVGTSASAKVVRSSAMPTSGGGACSTARSEVLRLVNQERTQRHLHGLIESTRLDTSAQVHSNAMASAHVLSHDNWVEEIRAAGYTGGWLGQNAAAGQTTSASVMQAWMNSDGHRANILNGTYRHLGVGCTRDGSGTYWWTQNFGAE
jgi:uncharacterized protein YkwD